ncbi:MAG: ABC transporter ATP-binding protein [Candidatus Brocadiae bacterium]|nr:ABC transporter ATP-binding protein [Candidatus Brocadiia bacterium]
MVRLAHVTKVYRRGKEEVHALKCADLAIRQGEFVTVVGPSGSGKSTLLLTIGGMLHPTQGTVEVGGTDVYALSGRARAKFRAERIGFVFQMFHLLPYLTVLGNVLLPGLIAARKSQRQEALSLLEHFGLGDRTRHKPSELSTGQRQRAAMVRALMSHPALLLADEPTGNLDPENARVIMDYFGEFHQNGGTIVLVSHERLAGEYADRVATIEDGRVRE